MFERFTKPARWAVAEAQSSARGAGAERIEPQHVFVGIVETADARLETALAECGLTRDVVRKEFGAAGDDLGSDDAEALASIGIDLDAVRESVEANFGDDAWTRSRPGKRGHLPFAKASKKALELGLREAVARRDNFIGSEHILLGLLRGADQDFVKALSAHITPAELRARLVTVLDDAA